MSAESVEALQRALELAKLAKREVEFTKELERYESIDPIKFFRDKIFGTKFGYWRYTGQGHSPNIYQRVDEPVMLSNVKYYWNGREIKQIPCEDDLFATSKRGYPDIQFASDLGVRYKYVFPGEHSDPFEEIYPALYMMAVKLSNVSA